MFCSTHCGHPSPVETVKRKEKEISTGRSILVSKCHDYYHNPGASEADREEGGWSEKWREEDSRGETYVKAKATRAPLTTIKSRMFHKSRKYEPWCKTSPRSTI
ncbi:hypothetical protein EYF80_006463 [Liparis tanakae]|uniref:Uncharacterized protein n=1 Tax=Liparis tanakae TaxID=230148 RepID=A0A4Z2J1X6_9TELE|nr:hypothetical protein EYF80_006463 [Liparis tanakae]